MAKLSISNKDGKAEIELQASTTLGRFSGSGILVSDPLISNNHCRIFLDPQGKYRIKDLGSRNGTYVNSRRIQHEVMLQNGDEITLGMTSIVFLSQAIEDFVSVEGEHSSALRGILPSVDPGSTRLIQWPETGSVEPSIPQSPPGTPPAAHEMRKDMTLQMDCQKLRAAVELHLEIGLELNLDRIFNRVLANIFKYLECEKALILTANEDGKMGVQAFRTRGNSKKLAIPYAVVKRVQQERIGLITTIPVRAGESLSCQSSISVPILDGDKLLGVVIVESPTNGPPYGEEDLQFLSNVAHQAGRLIATAQMAKRMEQEAVMRERFQRLLSPNMAEMVVSGKLKVEKGGETRFATVFFADIRGFTSMCENMEASEVLDFLNEYYEILVDVAFRHEGIVDKFMGDGIMLVWGAPVSHPDDPVRAVSAALEMQSAIEEYNQHRDTGLHGEVRMGIGINTDNVVAGYIGSSRTMSYSVVGDAVNVASRICSVAGPGRVLISQNTYVHVCDHFETTGFKNVSVKGRTRPVQVYGVIGPKKKHF